MNEREYKEFYDRVGQLNGWDFSKVKCISEGKKWDFSREVSRSCRKSDIVLDIGTGGGEALSSLAGDALLLVGIDQSAGMIATANANLRRWGKPNMRFLQMEADRLEFSDRFFNIVCCRQSPFCAKEAARVLAEDGVFLMQQVGENDKANLAAAFGRGQSTEEDGTRKNNYMAELSEAGFSDIRAVDYDATEYYETSEDLIFLLKYAPIVPDFGEDADDFAILHQFIEENRTGKGIKTNSKRYMITARK